MGGPAIAAVLLYLWAIYVVGRAYLPRRFDQPPKPSTLREDYLTTDLRETKLTVIDTILEAYTQNEGVIQKKVSAFTHAFVVTGVATGFLGAAIVVHIACLTVTPSWWPWPSAGC